MKVPNTVKARNSSFYTTLSEQIKTFHFKTLDNVTFGAWVLPEFALLLFNIHIPCNEWYNSVIQNKV
jgi:hypothetical protein